MGLVGYGVQFIVLVCLSALRLVTSCLRVVLFVAYTLLPFILLSVGLSLMQERWNESVAVLTDVFNGPLSSTVRSLVLTPILILDSVASATLPVYNFLVFAFVQMPVEILKFLLFKSDGPQHFMLALRALAAAAPELIRGGRAFVSANGMDACSSTYCIPNASCVRLADNVIAQACFDPQQRELDLLPALVHVQQAAAHGVMSLGASCQSAALILNVTLFPLTDPIAWFALDRAVNALLSGLVVAPLIAVQRCSIAGGFMARPAMCTPDLGHAWGLAATAMLSLGDALTHWTDALYLIVFEGDTIEKACTNANDYEDGLWADPAVRRLFGSNATALVRLSPQAFALTDGVSIVYVYESPMVKAYIPFAWPFPINTGYGVASVWLPSGVDAGDGGVGLFGCECTDTTTTTTTTTALSVRCATVTRSGSVYITPVEFSLGAEAQLLTCDRVRINVQSLRWSRRRAAVVHLGGGGGAPPPACASGVGAGCLAADAAVWLMPVCGTGESSQKALACFSEKSFTRGICFPYCMGLRMQHEGLVRPVMMRGAAEWTGGVIIASRDCVPITTTTTTTSGSGGGAEEGGGGGRTVCTVAADATGSKLPQVASTTTTTGGVISTPKCVWSSTCTTVFPNKTIFDGYSMGSVLPSSFSSASAQTASSSSSGGGGSSGS